MPATRRVVVGTLSAEVRELTFGEVRDWLVETETAPGENPEADRYFLNSVGQSMAARITGSADKLAQVMRSGDATQVYNAGLPQGYQVKTVGQVAKP